MQNLNLVIQHQKTKTRKKHHWKKLDKRMIKLISAILLLLGSMLMLATGIGIVSSKYLIAAGLGCYIVSVYLDGIFSKTT